MTITALQERILRQLATVDAAHVPSIAHAIKAPADLVQVACSGLAASRLIVVRGGARTDAKGRYLPAQWGITDDGRRRLERLAA